jgi:peroxiredoxin
MRTSLIILFLCTILFFDSHAQKPSETVPNFIFYNLDDTPFTNRNLTDGKETLFIFFDVTCDHCQHTIKALSTHIKECRKISIYLITLDEKSLINNFFNQYGMNLPGEKNVTILKDSRNQFIKQFGPRKYPSVFLYSSERKLLLYDDEDITLGKFLKIINHSKK